MTCSGNYKIVIRVSYTRVTTNNRKTAEKRTVSMQRAWRNLCGGSRARKWKKMSSAAVKPSISGAPSLLLHDLKKELLNIVESAQASELVPSAPENTSQFLMEAKQQSEGDYESSWDNDTRAAMKEYQILEFGTNCDTCCMPGTLPRMAIAG